MANLNHNANQNQLPTVRPDQSTIRYLANDIYNRMFHRKYNQRIIKYNSDDIIYLLNLLSQKDEIPQSLQFRWGDAVISAPAMKQCFNNFGVRGNKLQQQTKQAMASSVIVFDNNHNVTNAKHLKWMIPHTSNPGKNSFISKCAKIRADFDSNNTNILCVDEIRSRMS